MKRTFGWLGITTAALAIYLGAPSLAANNQQSLRTDSVPTVDLLAQRGVYSGSPRIIRVPIEGRTGGIPVIAVTLNGQKTFPMMVDTGASLTIITPQMARAIGFRQEGSEKIRVANGDIVDMPRGRISSIRVGDAEIRNFTVLVGSAPLLGQNFFSEYTVAVGQNAVIFRQRAR
jgi:aspartyl protease family protein